MKQCLIIFKVKSSDEHPNLGLWTVVSKDEEDGVIQSLGDKFIFSFELDTESDRTFLDKI